MSATPHSHRELDRAQIHLMLQELGQKLDAQGLESTIHVIGGAAIALTLRNSRITQDVDALVEDHSQAFHRAAIQVARDHNIQPGWISDDVSDFVASSPEGEETELIYPGLNVYVASPEHLLAMKVRASTVRMAEKDAEDLVFLAEHLGLESPEAIAELTARQFQGIYRDNIGRDEYVATAQDAFVVHDLQRGIDPMLRWQSEAPAQPATRPRPSPSAEHQARIREISRKAAELDYGDENSPGQGFSR